MFFLTKIRENISLSGLSQNNFAHFSETVIVKKCKFLEYLFLVFHLRVISISYFY